MFGLTLVIKVRVPQFGKHCFFF